MIRTTLRSFQKKLMQNTLKRLLLLLIAMIMASLLVNCQTLINAMELKDKSMGSTRSEVICLLPISSNIIHGSDFMIWLTPNEDRGSIIFKFNSKGSCSSVAVERKFNDQTSLQLASTEYLGILESNYGPSQRNIFSPKGYSLSMIPVAPPTIYFFEKREGTGPIILTMDPNSMKVITEFMF